ncbi:MAG: ABC transporter substrate-binding protein [Acidobacteriota bacterium]|nr:ABC transporter substrate-binding protein [Acidobacteriota bacterium]
MSRNWIWNATFPLMLICGIAAPGCGGPGAEEPGGPVRLVVGLGAEPDSFNIYLARSAASLLVADLVLPRLAREELPFEGHPGGLVPDLAASWEIDDQGRRVTFHLEDGHGWDDGRPVTCEDLQFTLAAQTSEAVAWRGASIKRHIQRLVCPDPLTAVYHFDRGYPGQVMDINDLHVLSSSLESIPFDQWRKTDWAQALVAGGPFRIERVSAGQEIVLTRRTPAAAGAIEEIILRVVPDASSRTTQLLAGDLDLIEAVAPDQLPRLERDPDVRIVRRPGHRYTYLGWNVLDPQAYATWRRSKEDGCRRKETTPAWTAPKKWPGSHACIPTPCSATPGCDGL